MNISVDEVQSRIAAVLDQDEDTTAISSDDYSLRLRYINLAQNEWSERADWDALYKEYNMVISTSTGNTSVVLPGDFRKLAARPIITYDGATTKYFEEIRPQERSQKNSTDKFVEILPDETGGYTLLINSALSSGASVKVPYYASPQSLASPANISRIPNSDYLVHRTLAYVWESRSDERFPQAKAESEKILQVMLEKEVTKGESYDDRIKTADESKHDFRWGKN